METSISAKEAFRDIVARRGQHLRGLNYETLVQMTSVPNESITVNGRKASIGTIVELRSDGRARVVVQGFLKALIKAHVELDGFCKSKDGTIEKMPDDEFHEFD